MQTDPINNQYNPPVSTGINYGPKQCDWVRIFQLVCLDEAL